MSFETLGDREQEQYQRRYDCHSSNPSSPYFWYTTAKFIRLNLYGTETPHTQLVEQLQVLLTHRLVELIVKAIAPSLVRKATMSMSFLNFLKWSLPAKVVDLSFQLPVFVKDSYLYCIITRQILSQVSEHTTAVITVVVS